MSPCHAHGKMACSASLQVCTNRFKLIRGRRGLLHGIINDLRWNSPWDRTAVVAAVFAVGFVRLPTALVGFAADNLPVQPLHVIAAGNKTLCQPVEQLGVAGRIGWSELVSWLNNPDVKISGPDTINKRPGKPGVILFPQPIHDGFARIAVSNLNRVAAKKTQLLFSCGRNF